MLVTEIKEISKTKVLICVDYDVVFALYKSECRKYSIKLNEEISCDNYCEIVNNILFFSK